MDNTKPIKVLHVMSGFGGGISSHIRNLAQVVDPNKITFDVISFTDYSEDFKNEIANINGRTFTFLKPKKVGFFKFYKDALSTIKENGPYDVMLCHTSGHYAAVFKLLSKQAKIKRFIVHAHKTQYDNMDRLKDKMKVRFDKFISTFTATQMTSCSTESSRFVFGDRVVEKNQVMHIPNSIPLEKYIYNLTEEEKLSIKKENDIPTNKLLIGNVGRFNLQKNHEFMVKLIKYLATDGVDFTWLFIGAGELEDEIKALVSKEKLEDYVLFLGRREDANVLYQILDVFVLPSFYEGLPTVIVETQAAGVPSVISDTITREVDLGLNLVSYLSLENSLEEWKEEILKLSKSEIPSAEIRRNKLNEKGFSNQVAGRLYEDFLWRKINTFKIGESYKNVN